MSGKNILSILVPEDITWNWMNHLLEPCLNLQLQNCEYKNGCDFEQQNFGVICFVAADIL